MDDDDTCAAWIMCDESLREALELAATGMDIDLILLELYANSDIEEIEPEDAEVDPAEVEAD
jgi:hypothetical protein